MNHLANRITEAHVVYPTRFPKPQPSLAGVLLGKLRHAVRELLLALACCAVFFHAYWGSGWGDVAIPALVLFVPVWLLYRLLRFALGR